MVRIEFDPKAIEDIESPEKRRDMLTVSDRKANFSWYFVSEPSPEKVYISNGHGSSYAPKFDLVPCKDRYLQKVGDRSGQE